MVISWHENLPEHEIPPQWMWPFPEELESWFQRVDEARKEGRGGSGDDPKKKPSDDRFSGGARNDLVRQLKEAERDRPRPSRVAAG